MRNEVQLEAKKKSQYVFRVFKRYLLPQCFVHELLPAILANGEFHSLFVGYCHKSTTFPLALGQCLMQRPLTALDSNAFVLAFTPPYKLTVGLQHLATLFAYEYEAMASEEADSRLIGLPYLENLQCGRE